MQPKGVMAYNPSFPLSCLYFSGGGQRNRQLINIINNSFIQKGQHEFEQMSRKAEQPAYDNASKNEENSTGDSKTRKAICDPLLQEYIKNQVEDCIENYEQVIVLGKLLVRKLVKQNNKQALAAVSVLLKKSSEFYASAVEELRSNPFIKRLFNSNQAIIQSLAQDLERTKDDTIFIAVNMFLTETLPSSKQHIEAISRVLYGNQVSNDVDLDLVKADLEGAYHSFSLFKEASRHLSLGFLSLQKYFSQDTHISFINLLYQQFVWLETQVKIAHIFVNALFTIEDRFRMTANAQKKKNISSNKNDEKALSRTEIPSPQITSHKTVLAQSKASEAKEVQASRKSTDLFQKTASQSKSFFSSALWKVFNNFFYRQEPPIKYKDDDDEELGQHLLTEENYNEAK